MYRYDPPDGIFNKQIDLPPCVGDEVSYTRMNRPIKGQVGYQTSVTIFRFKLFTIALFRIERDENYTTIDPFFLLLWT